MSNNSSVIRVSHARRVMRFAGLDFHVAVTLLFRSWSIVAGAMMVVCVPLWFSDVEQGYYYTFASLIGLQVFFELGINQVVVQLVGHEVAHIEWTADGEIRGDRKHVERLASLIRLLRKWYAVAASGFFLAVCVAGLVFFEHRGALPRGQWLGAWFLLVAFSSVNLYFSPMLAVLEGCGQVGQVARLRLLQSIAGYFLLWAALTAKAGLWGVPIVAGTAAIGTAWWLRTDKAFLGRFASPGAASGTNKVTWRRDIFPFQWRIALSWISGYFMLQLFTPVTFAHHGAAAAGKLGIALSIFSALLTVGMSWANTKIPVYAGHISRGERQALNRVFVGAVLRSVGFTAVATGLFLLAVWLLGIYDAGLTARIASLPVLACIAVGTVANALIFSAAGYMRAHREEPLLLQSISVGTLVTLAVCLTAEVSVVAMMASYAAVTTLVALPWTLWLLRKYYRRTS